VTEKKEEHINIIGFRNVQLKNINGFLEQFKEAKIGTAVQFFDAKYVAGSQHLYFAALHALNAFDKNLAISNNLAVEALLYASTQRQIKKAVQMLGIKEGTSELAVLIILKKGYEKLDCISQFSEMVHGERDDTVLELTDKKVKKIKKVFSISDLEIEAKLKKDGLEKEALTDLVIERMALLVTKS
jgi:KEOPS complex subunit Cgi121